MSVSGAGCRRKGVAYERELVHRFAEIFGADQVRRGLQFRDGNECPDVIAPGVWVEAKRGRKTNIRGALRQALAGATGKGRFAVAICKDDHEPATATMDLEDFLELLREWWTGRARTT